MQSNYDGTACPMTRRDCIFSGVLLSATVWIFVGCGSARSYPSSTVFTEVAQLNQFTQNFVRVALILEEDPRHKPILRATFTPMEQGLHLYGKELPENGVKGIGVPTRLELLRHPLLKAAGPVFADVASRDLEVK